MFSLFDYYGAGIGGALSYLLTVGLFLGVVFLAFYPVIVIFNKVIDKLNETGKS